MAWVNPMSLFFVVKYLVVLIYQIRKSMYQISNFMQIFHGNFEITVNGESYSRAVILDQSPLSSSSSLH